MINYLYKLKLNIISFSNPLQDKCILRPTFLLYSLDLLLIHTYIFWCRVQEESWKSVEHILCLCVQCYNKCTVSVCLCSLQYASKHFDSYGRRNFKMRTSLCYCVQHLRIRYFYSDPLFISKRKDVSSKHHCLTYSWWIYTYNQFEWDKEMAVRKVWITKTYQALVS